jgi:hypothetical protein
MHERIEHGANLLKNNVFQFDFLNDEFIPISKGGKLPDSLYDIITNEAKRKKLVVYINPPYAEASNRDTVIGVGENKSKVATETVMYTKFQSKVGTGVRELYVQFLMRIYFEIPGCKTAVFSKLKHLQSSNFSEFRKVYKSKLEMFFICPANSFDNVKGNFPIGFQIWNADKSEIFENVIADIYDDKKNLIGFKNIYSFDSDKSIIQWLRNYYDKNSERISFLRMIGTDFQNSQGVFLTNNPSLNDIKKSLTSTVTKNNIIQVCIYLTVRHCFDATWINDRDQFLFPKGGWITDSGFQNDCLTYTFFSGQNKITSLGLVNHWIPFTEHEVNAKAKFESNFMTDFIKGKIKNEVSNETLFKDEAIAESKPLVFSDEATAVFDAGRELWKYYHAQNDVDIIVNASFYDIRAYFQGTNAQGKMNPRSEDATYTKLIGDLRNKLSVLADKIKPKVYEYGFLKE